MIHVPIQSELRFKVYLGMASVADNLLAHLALLSSGISSQFYQYDRKGNSYFLSIYFIDIKDIKNIIKYGPYNIQ